MAPKRESNIFCSGSSFVMVPIPALSWNRAPDTFESQSTNVSLPSSTASSRTATRTVFTLSPAAKVNYANPAARAAWENSDWVIFLAQKDESVELLKSEKRIHCDAGMERALKSLTTADGRFAEIVLHGPDGWRVLRLVLDAWSVALYSSRGPAFAAVERAKAEGLTTVEAIDRIAGADTPTTPGLADGGAGGEAAEDRTQDEGRET